MRARDFIIVEGYKEAKQDFLKDTDEQTVEELIAKFKKLVNTNQVTGQERNIDFWRKQGFRAFEEFVNRNYGIPTKTQVKRHKVVGQSINLVENDQWLVVIPLDKNASCFYGKASSWCTTKPNQNNFERYFYDNEVILIYCLNKVDSSMWAVAGHKKLSQIECFDQDDNALTPAKFQQLTGLDPKALTQQAIADHSPEIAKSREPYQTAKAHLKGAVHKITGRDLEVEKNLLFTKDAYSMYAYVSKVQQVAPQELTQIPEQIKIQACTSYPSSLMKYFEFTPKQYHDMVRNNGQVLPYVPNPTPEMIDMALKSAPFVVTTLPDVDVNMLIEKYPEAAAYWAQKNKTRLPTLEPKLIKEKKGMWVYLDLVTEPWPEAEPVILENGMHIIKYVVNALKGQRWPEGEKELLELGKKNPKENGYNLVDYATKTKMPRWPEAEPILLEDPISAASYCLQVTKKPWPAIEDALAEITPSTNSDDADIVRDYAKQFGTIDDWLEQHFPEDLQPDEDEYDYDYGRRGRYYDDY